MTEYFELLSRNRHSKVSYGWWSHIMWESFENVGYRYL